jgi:WD40 repeat protein
LREKQKCCFHAKAEVIGGEPRECRYLAPVGVFLKMMRRSWRGRSAGVALVVTCLALALFASTAMATFPGADGRIVFGSQHGIATMNPDGSDVRYLHRSGTEPSWSADGQWIAYVCNDGVYDQICRMRADGSNVHLLTGGDPKASPSFSPGGGRIVYWQPALRTDPNRVMVMRSDGSDQHVVTRVGIYPEWAPNGKHIVYSMISGIGVMRPDGSHSQVIYPPDQRTTLWYPHYTPNSRSILVSVLGEGATLRMGAFGGDPHLIDIAPITFGAQVAPAGGCIVGMGDPPGGGTGSAVYARGARCAARGLLMDDAGLPSWAPASSG